MIYRVHTYLDVAEPIRPIIKGVLVGSLDIFPGLEAEVREADLGIEVVTRIEAHSESTAASKARYWIEKAAKRTKGVRWTGKSTQDAKVEPWT